VLNLKKRERKAGLIDGFRIRVEKKICVRGKKEKIGGAGTEKSVHLDYAL